MILSCGEALFDIFLDGDISADPIRFTAHIGGSPFNVAVGIARLGGRSALLTGVSRDMLGERLHAVLVAEGVSTDYLARSGNRTTLSLVGVDNSGQPEYVFYGLESADRNVTPDDIPPLTPEITCLHFGSYSLVVPPVADTFSSLLKHAGDRFVSLDPNIRPTVEPDIDIWRDRVSHFAGAAHLLKVSSEDMETLYPGIAHETAATDWIDKGVGLVVVTDGANEVAAWTKSGVSARVKPASIKVVDLVGAGDSFQAALLVRLAENLDPSAAATALDQKGLAELLQFATCAAQITCSRRGADLPHLSDLAAATDQFAS